MKRIYKKRTSTAIKKQALEQLKETREALNEQYPDLLDSVRTLIEQSGKQQGELQESINSDEMVYIDKKKNMETVLRFMELKPNSSEFKRTLSEFLH